MLTELLFKVLGFWPVRKTLFVPLRRRLAKFEAATHHLNGRATGSTVYHPAGGLHLRHPRIPFP